MRFPISGVECSPFVPPLVSFVIASLVTSAGVSGAFLLLPFQMSVLGYTAPGVSPTNLIYNIVAIPGGVYRYIRERRMMWPLAWVIIAGTLPGVFFGAVIRVRYLPNPAAAKVFVGCVLLYLGWRLFNARPTQGSEAVGETPVRFTPFGLDAVVKTKHVSVRRVVYEFRGREYAFSTPAVFTLAAVVGLVGGIYGIGGGAIIAPFVVAAMGLPVYTVAGAALLGTFITSIAGVACFELLGTTTLAAGAPVRPDYLLGSLFGVGGLFGTYVGARIQRFLPERWIRLALAFLVTGVALNYIGQFLLR